MAKKYLEYICKSNISTIDLLQREVKDSSIVKIRNFLFICDEGTPDDTKVKEYIIDLSETILNLATSIILSLILAVIVLSDYFKIISIDIMDYMIVISLMILAFVLANTINIFYLKTHYRGKLTRYNGIYEFQDKEVK